KVFSYACIYVAIVKNGVERPYELIFHELAEANERLTVEVAAHWTTAKERDRVEEALRESEAQVRKKLDAILLPEGDLDTLVLQDILDVPAVREIMEALFRLTGITSALLDPQGRVLVGLGSQDICTHYHRAHPEACKNCTESDTMLASQVEPGGFKLYKCKNNLWDLAAPIHVNGRHVGNLFIGQFFFQDEVPDGAIFKAQARQFGFDEAEYLAALARVPRVSRSTVSALGQFYARFSAMISNLSYSSIRFTKMLNEREEAEAEKARLQVQLQQSQKLESLGTLAGGVAHDMNNVLGAILGLASAHLGAQPQGSPLHQALDTICKATERGGKMVKSLLSFARQSPAENRRVDLNAVLREQAGLLSRTTLAKVCLRLELDPDLQPICGDANALTHTFMNLCVNAVDAMPEKGTLTLHTRNIDHDWVEVVVEDDGVGMPPQVLERAMDPFFTTKDPGKGTGLGLSMAYNTVKAHRGRMDIHSEPGQGTRVSLRFPACLEEAFVEAQGESQAAPSSDKSLKVLLIDDDELIRSSLQLTLEVLGHPAVTTAQSGEEALDLLETGLRPDIVILDMNMPGLGGAGTLPCLRALCPEVPVILSTGRSDQTALSLIASYPGVTLLAKPFGLPELEKHLGTIGVLAGRSLKPWSV
ncbi:MAG: response regulator, partial [Holophagaceae bacterium]|nr:response regulator [Holophagaceae bacterium]